MASPTSLSAWLAHLSEDQLADILRRRGDVLRGRAPRTIGELADRLQHVHSVYSAIGALTVPQLQVAEALAALGAETRRARVIDLLGSPDVDDALAGLSGLALVWPHGDGLRSAAPLRQIFGRPLGLDPPADACLRDRTLAELGKLQAALGLRRGGGNKAAVTEALCARYADAEFVRERAAAQPAEVRDLLARRAEPDDGSGPDIVAIMGVFDPREYSRHKAAETAAAAAGLLIPGRWGQESIMPAEVALALRGPQWHPPFDPRPPQLLRAEASADAVAQEASAALSQFADHAAAALDAVAAAPLSCLKSGGLGAREITRLAKRIGSDDTAVRLILELAADAGLVAVRSGQVIVTAGHQAWRDQEPAERTVPLLVEWWAHADTPTATRGADGKAEPALLTSQGCEPCRDGRQMLLRVLAELDPGSGTTADSTAMLAWWRRPSAHYVLGEDRKTLLAWREAQLLGVLAHGALTPVGHALVAGDSAALAQRLGALLPRSARTARFGSDLTVLVAGSPSAEIRSLLDSCADREGRGAGAMWRISPASVRRALDAGRTSEQVSAELTAIATGELPQPLRYLIADVGRRHGHLRVVTAATCVLAEDTALLAEVAAHRSLRSLGPRLLAPTVLACDAPVADLLTTLRNAGYLPVAEDETGQVRVERRAPVRAPRPAAPRPVVPAPAQPDVLAVARALRRPGAAPVDPQVSGTEFLLEQFASALDPGEIRQLAHAIEHGESVLLDYTSASGGHTSRVVSELELDPPYLSGWCHLREDERIFTLSRIRSVSAV